MGLLIKLLTIFMRRRSINRPKEKLRGVKRRLRSVDRWAGSFDGYFPLDHKNEKYCNWKIPVLDRLVCPPTTNKELQAHCMKAMLRAAKSIAKSKSSEDATVTVLITFPNMFSSEICVFFDDEYFQQFYSRNNSYESMKQITGRSLALSLGTGVPEGWSENGFVYSSREEWEGEVTEFSEEWWCYSE